MGSVVSLVPAEPEPDIVAQLRKLADGIENGTYARPAKFVYVSDGECFTTGVIGMISPSETVGLLHIAAQFHVQEALED